MLMLIQGSTNARRMGCIRSGIYAGQLMGMGLLQSTQQQVKHRMDVVHAEFAGQKMTSLVAERAVGMLFSVPLEVQVARYMGGA